MLRAAVVVAVIGLCGCEKGKPATPKDAAPPKATTTRLVAHAGACTELACEEDALCCNACQIDGWFPPGAATALVGVSVAPGVPALPEGEIDRCGRPPFELEAQVVQTGNQVVVHAWKQVAAPPSCDIKLLTKVDGGSQATIDGSKSVTLEAWLVSGTTVDQTFTIPDRCPGIDVAFTGFGNTKIYDGSCMQGQCAPSTPATKTITLPAGGRVQVAVTSLQKKMTCGDEVAAGTYTIDFAFPAQGATTCSAPATVTVK